MNYEFDPTLTGGAQNSYAEGMANGTPGQGPESSSIPDEGIVVNGQTIDRDSLAQIEKALNAVRAGRKDADQPPRPEVNTLESAPVEFGPKMKAMAKDAQPAIEKDDLTKTRPPREHLEALLKDLSETGKPGKDVRTVQTIESIVGMGWKAKRALESTPGLEKEMQALEGRLKKITDVTAQDANTGRLMTLELGNDLRKYYGYEKLRNESADFYSTPKNLEDLVERISDVVSDEFSVGGKHALISINPETGEKMVNKDNLLLWIRRRVWFYHDLNETSKINLLQDIQLPTATRAYYLIELYGTDAYWGKRAREIYQEVPKQNGKWITEIETGRGALPAMVMTDRDGNIEIDGGGRVQLGILGSDKDGNTVVQDVVPAEDLQISKNPDDPKDISIFRTRESSHRMESYERLRDDLLYEPYLADFIHNSGVEFRAAMASEDELAKVLGGIYSKPNAMTEARSRLAKILHYGSTDRTVHRGNGEGEIDRQVEDNDYESQGTVGKAIQRLLNAYDYMAEVNLGETIKGVDENGKNKDYDNLFRKSLGKEGTDEFYREVIRITLDKKFPDKFSMAKKLTGKLNAVFVQEIEGGNRGAFRERYDWEKVDVLDVLLLNKSELLGRFRNENLGITEETYNRVVGELRDELRKAVEQEKYAPRKAKMEAALAGQLNELTNLSLSRKSQVSSQDLRREFLNTLVSSGYGLTDDFVKSGAFNDFVNGKMSLENFAFPFSKQIWDSKNGNFLNIFASSKEVGDERNMVRNALRAAMVKKMKLSAFEAKYAEIHAYDLAYIFGSTAKNDVNGIGFNAWSKLMNIGRYREGQTEGKNAYGNIFTIHGIKKIGFTFYEGLRVQRQGESGYGDMTKGTTFREILQGGRGDNMDLDRDIDSFDFYENSMSQFNGDHIQNAFTVLKMLNRIEIEFNKLVAPDPRTGAYNVDSQAFWEFIDKFWKPIRYMLDLQAPNYNAEFRTWTYTESVGESGKINRSVKMTTQSLKNLMFGDKVQDMNMYGFERETKTAPGMARNVLAFIIAEQIRMHRQWPSNRKGGIFKHYGLIEIEMLRTLFNSMTRSVAFEGEDVRVLRDFFTVDEWDRILQEGVLGNSSKVARLLLWFNNPWWRLYFGEYGGDTAGFAADITRELFGSFFKMIFSGLKVGG